MNALKGETPMESTELQVLTATKLARISWLSQRDRGRKFDCLMHHIDRETLTACFHELSGQKAVGLDKVTKDTYGADLEENISHLLEKMKRMAYRPGPMRRVLIPKEGKLGATRPLDIGNFEDKMVQKAMARVLEAVYEPVFYDCSFGFRPGRGCHDAIRRVQAYLSNAPVGVVIDIDLENFFGSIKPEILKAILREKIGDERLIRYIMRGLKAGVLSEGELVVNEEGVPQGSPISPILANIVAHHVIDEWFEKTVKAHCTQEVALFRYCDDMVISCASPKDGARIRKALALRLAKFGLKLNEDKTHSVNFSRYGAKLGYRQDSFDFLGLTFYLGKTRSSTYKPKVKTSRKRFRSKLAKIKVWAKAVRSQMPLVDLWRIFQSKLRGHIAYYAISDNLPTVEKFVHEARKIVWRWLNRRGGKRRLTWAKFELLQQRFPLPQVSLKHNLYAKSQPAQ